MNNDEQTIDTLTEGLVGVDFLEATEIIKARVQTLVANHDTQKKQELLAALPDKPKTKHDKCSWIQNGYCTVHRERLTGDEIRAMFVYCEALGQCTQAIEKVYGTPVQEENIK